MPTAVIPVPDLEAELKRLLRQIPPGRVTTYGDLAEALGTLSAARWVGEYLVEHAHNADCPCHRVVRRTGELGRFVAGDSLKSDRLRAEGVEAPDDRVDLARYRFGGFTSSRPLMTLLEFQQRLPGQTRQEPLRAPPELVAGVDVSYAGGGYASATYVLFAVKRGEQVWSTTITAPIRFPYIPGLLSFREAPLLLELLEDVRTAGRLADVIIVDGHGRLHPRRAGIATHFGVAADVPTIGLGKSLLCGRVDLAGLRPGESRAIEDQGEVLGRAVVASESSRPVYVSPGHRIDLAGAVAVVQRLFDGHRLPEPIHHADRLSRQAVRAARSS